MAQLVAENAQLRERLRQRSAGPVQEDTGQEPQGNADADLHQLSEPGQTGHSQSVVSGIFISANGDSSYHGLTSTLFDGARVGQQDPAELADPAIPIEPIRKQLMGEAAFERKSNTGFFPSRRAVRLSIGDSLMIT